MSWDEALATRYEEWSAPMTADVPFYVDLARQANGPLVELAIGNGRVAIPVAQATGQRVIGIDTSAAMLELARGADLLPIPRTPAPAHLGRSPPHLRTRRRRAAAERSLRLECLRVRPPHRGAARQPAPGQARPAHGPLRRW